MPEFDLKELDEDAVLKEVWNVDNVEAKTELEDHQIESVNKIKTLSSIFSNELLSDHVKDFMILQKSRKRKSMDEFVKVVRAKREDFVEKGKGFFGSMMG